MDETIGTPGQQDSVARQFELAWEGYPVPDFTRFLEQAGPLEAEVLREVIGIDLERRWQLAAADGQQTGRIAGLPVRPLLEDYIAAVQGDGVTAGCTPGDNDLVTAGLLAREFRVRQQWGDQPDGEEYAVRFPQLASTAGPLLAELQQQLSSGWESRARLAADTNLSLRDTILPVDSPSATQSNQPRRLGRYELRQQVGEGGMGSVYLAFDTVLKRKVALKVPRFAGPPSPTLLERFKREAETLAALSHPRICQVFDAGSVDDTHYLAMEWIEGQTLAIAAAGKPPLPHEAADLIRQVAEALAAAHAEGIVHRDLKPANIMINRRGEPVVMDFGLALRQIPDPANRLTQSGTLLGTVAYMSPEQATGEVDRVGPASDIYSLGVILYELLTGQVPFEGPTVAVLNLIANAEPPRPESRNPQTDPSLAALCLQALEKRPEDRFPSMEAFSSALEQWQASADRDTPAPSAVERHAGSTTVANGRRSAVLVAAGILVTLGLVWWQVGSTDPPVEAPPATPASAPPPASDTAPATLAKPAVDLIRSFEVFRFSGTVDDARIGRDSFHALERDHCRVTAKLKQPAWCYLIAFNPDGSVQLCLPADETDPPEPVDRITYPAQSGFGFELTDGPGQQVFALICSRNALPPFAEWRRQAGQLHWQPGTGGGVLEFDGAQVASLDGDSREHHPADGLPLLADTRGQVTRIGGRRSFDQLCRRLGQHADSVRAVTFPVAPLR